MQVSPERLEAPALKPGTSIGSLCLRPKRSVISYNDSFEELTQSSTASDPPSGLLGVSLKVCQEECTSCQKGKMQSQAFRSNLLSKTQHAGRLNFVGRLKAPGPDQVP